MLLDHPLWTLLLGMMTCGAYCVLHTAGIAARYKHRHIVKRTVKGERPM